MGYSDKAILVECMTYATAGMMTTREFIVMCAWHMFEKPELRERFLNGDDPDKFAILEEILRLEPVASLVHRRAAEPVESTADLTFAPAGQTEGTRIRLRPPLRGGVPIHDCVHGFRSIRYANFAPPVATPLLPLRGQNACDTSAEVLS